VSQLQSTVQETMSSAKVDLDLTAFRSAKRSRDLFISELGRAAPEYEAG
jgi:hypothetical protein